MTTDLATNWLPLGTGRQSLVGALTDARLTARLAAYKHDVAGAYSSLALEDVARVVPAGPCLVSPKLDGMTAFLLKRGAQTVVLTPRGQVLADLPLTQEAAVTLGAWEGLLAGELYAETEIGRPTIYGLLSALGGGAATDVARLRFAAFDLLQDGATDVAGLPYTDRAARCQSVLAAGTLAHAVPVTMVHTVEDVVASYQRLVVDAGGEGLVLNAADGRVYKLKPVVTLDAVVVGYTATDAGVTDLLLGLLPPDQPGDGYAVQLIGRVDVGFSASERRQLARALAASPQPAALALTNRAGRPYQWVAPQLVVEVQCHELLSTDAEGQPILRWRLGYAATAGWTPQGKRPSVSLRDAVFLRVRPDKAMTPQTVRWSQVTDLVPIAALPPSPDELPPAAVLRRAVYTKAVREGGVAVRKVVLLAPTDPAVAVGYPPYLIATTDFSPERQEPLRTGLQVAGTVEAAQQMVDTWLATATGRGWRCVSTQGEAPPVQVEAVTPAGRQTAHTLTIACARSTSPTFPIVRRRLDALAALGTLSVTTDERGKEVWFELTVGDLIPSYRRLANLLALVRRWKTCEISLDGEALDPVAVDDVLNRLEEIRRCWQRHQSGGAAGCRRACALGCAQLVVVPSQRYLQAAATREPEWWTVGQCDGRQVTVDKAQLLVQVDRRRNRLVACCPHFNRRAVETAIAALPVVITPDDGQWQVVYHRDDGQPAWIWPVGTPLPPRLTERGVPSASVPDRARDYGVTRGREQVSAQATRRTLPLARYTDVCGQDAAIAAVREVIELPLQHAAYFTALGAPPQPGGVLLAGPPGTGKTLLARAVAAECGVHLEVIAGPEILSQWVGGSEHALREVFARAQQAAPSLILIDELDSIAPARSRADAQHQQSLVAQLLVLLDGLDARRGIAVLATTNRPQAIDPALRRPGRFDRVVWMRPPDEQGRAAILRTHLASLRLAETVDRGACIADLAAQTDGATGADLAYLCQSAARRCVQEAVQDGVPLDAVVITHVHLQQTLQTWLADQLNVRHRTARMP
jgi:AAA+ superfamily predicted ATPase/ATP-dependent DNA ligase